MVAGCGSLLSKISPISNHLLLLEVCVFTVRHRHSSSIKINISCWTPNDTHGPPPFKFTFFTRIDNPKLVLESQYLRPVKHLIMRASLSVFVSLLFASSACARVIPAWMMKDPPVPLNTRDIDASTMIRHAPESSFERRIDDRLE